MPAEHDGQRDMLSPADEDGDGRHGDPRPRDGTRTMWRLSFFMFQVALCAAVVLIGLLGPEPQAAAELGREGCVILGLGGMVMSAVWYFFGTIGSEYD